jgi:hypothetical protein
MDNLIDLIFGIVYNDHDSDLIGRDQVDDYTIDTCLTADQGYETAVWVADHNMVIVARYATKNDAVKALETLDGIIDSLDWSGVFIDDELNNIEKSMAIIQQFIEQEEK